MMISANAVLTGSYTYSEVARSILIAIAGSYAAFDLAGRVTAASGRARAWWLAGGAIAMGIGIWEMHFKGLLAFRLPVPVFYHWPTVLASFLVAVTTSAIALLIVSQQKMGAIQLWTGSFIMGGGIAALHYIDMAAMRMAAVCRYDLRIIILSIVLGIVFSFVALTLAFGMRGETRGTPWRRIASALVMGAAISVMHYTGMASATFLASPVVLNLSHAVNISPLANGGVSTITLLVLGAAIVTSAADRQAKAKVRRANECLEQRVAERTRELEAINKTLRKEDAERKRAEEALKKSEEKFSTVFRLSPMAITLTTVKDHRYVNVNEAFERVTGWRRDEVIGRTPFDLGLWVNPAERVELARRILAERRLQNVEAALRRKDGALFTGLGTAEMIELNGEPCAINVFTEITERKRAEAALRNAQAELAHVTRVLTMGELVASIAHEVYQPLTGILTTGNFVLRQLANTPNLEKVQKAVTEIVEDANRISAVISRVRTLLSRGVPDRVELNINDVIQEVTVLVRSEAAQNHVHLQLDLGTGLLHVMGDRVQLQQVLINLIVNGIDAMRSVTGRPRNLDITSAKHADGVLVRVQDSGTGVDPNNVERIFEPFFTTKRQGIGMGLSISRSIIESHGGRLWAEPGPLGAIFQFTLPT